MSLDKTYDPQSSEDSVYKLWEKTGVFKPSEQEGKEAYSIVVPPPNANADLHLGHGLTLALEDIAIRYNRMKGRAALFLPGADHAGFETQVVYEKHLERAGKSRFDFSREELYKQIWDFVAENKDNYQSQFRKLGASLDWTRYVYTLDQKIVDRAYKTFKKMWDDNLIYRGERLVNYCTFHGTGFADIEVEYETEKGKMYYIRFPLVPIKNKPGEKSYILIATTRPETMLGDVAVAVHPEDARYKNLVGRTVKIPLANREVPVIADEMVDQSFGTGAVKITAAHDPNDFDVARKHNLPLLKVITEQGTIGHDAPHEYHNLPIEEGRNKVVSELEKLGLLEKTEQHVHRVGHCYKCKNVIQPLPKEQWFIDMKPLVGPAIKALEEKQIKFYPDNKRTQLIRYLNGLRDWNISRQIAWGIPIPAFVNVDDPDEWIFDTSVEKEEIKIGQKTFRRDPDVFDTWFSSASWPYATLDFPDGEDFDKFYPLSLMETGADILYPWVSRMIMFGLYNTGEVPFRAVYLHGLIQDEHGAKMSKSKGNVVNPMDKVSKYGSDAFRMGIVADEAAGQNRPYDESKLVGARNFCNKLWNLARYIDSLDIPKKQAGPDSTPLNIADEWINNKISQAIKKISTCLDNYRFAEAYETLYHLLWDDYADWYIESSKVSLTPDNLLNSFETILKLAHPFAPFVSEAIWQALEDKPDILAASNWPETPKFDAKKARQFETIIDIVISIRTLTTALKAGKVSAEFEHNEFLISYSEVIAKLAGLKSFSSVKKGSGQKISVEGYEIWLDIPDDKVDKYRDEVEDKIAEQKQRKKQLESRLANKSYVKNAPKELVNQTKSELDNIKISVSDLEKELGSLI